MLTKRVEAEAERKRKEDLAAARALEKGELRKLMTTWVWKCVGVCVDPGEGQAAEADGDLDVDLSRVDPQLSSP